MANPLEGFTLLDLVDLKERALRERVSRQARSIIDAIYKRFAEDPSARYAMFTDGPIHRKNVEHLVENGFRVWRAGGTYYVCWDADDFAREVLGCEELCGEN